MSVLSVSKGILLSLVDLDLDAAWSRAVLAVGVSRDDSVGSELCLPTVLHLFCGCLLFSTCTMSRQLSNTQCKDIFTLSLDLLKTRVSCDLNRTTMCGSTVV